MLIDGRSVPANTTLSADLCIIGAGAAGITLAMELAGSQIKVLLLESGGFELEAEASALNQGEVTGLPTFPLEASRLRAFGGATGHWGGFVRRFDECDFIERPWIPHSGWPIGLSDLLPHYLRAEEIVQVMPGAYDPDDWNLGGDGPVPLSSDIFRTRIMQYSPPTRFGVRYRDNILKAQNVRLALHANVTEIVPNRDLKQVTELKVATVAGNQFAVRATNYVLAAGGIENARLLLSSNSVARNGIANESDTVGRYFADHINLDSAGLYPLNEKMSFDIYQRDMKMKSMRPKQDPARPFSIIGYIGLTEKAQRATGLLNFSTELTRTNFDDFFLHRERYDYATQSGTKYSDNTLTRFEETLKTLWRNLGDAVSVGVRSSAGKQPTFYRLNVNQEQAPNPDSRVTLGSAVDRFGMPRVRLDWQLTELDRQALKRSLNMFAHAVGSSGIGRLHVSIDLDGPGWPVHMQSSWHACGTTRMHANPQKGVVNRDCRTHSIGNLYIAGASVFTSDGVANPTNTLVALAVRLAAHLRGKMK